MSPQNCGSRFHRDSGSTKRFALDQLMRPIWGPSSSRFCRVLELKSEVPAYAGSIEARNDLKTARDQSAFKVKQNASLRHTYSSPPQASAIFVCFRKQSVPESALGIHGFSFRQGFQAIVADFGLVLLWTNSQRHVGCLPHSGIPKENGAKSRRVLRYLIRRNPPMSLRYCPP